MPTTPALRDATVQDIQLELIRRTRFNDVDGERVLGVLTRFRGHWRAVLLDRPGLPNYREPAALLTGGSSSSATSTTTSGTRTRSSC